MTDFRTAKLASDKPNNIRKTLGVIALIAPISEDPIEKLTGPDKGLITFPEAWKYLGQFAEDGLEFSKEVETEEVRALGYKTAQRKDYTSEEHAITLTAFDIDSRTISELTDGMDLSTVQVDADGEVAYDVAELTSARQYRIICIATDYNKETGAEIYRARLYRNVEVSEFPSENWTADDPVQAELSFTARADDDGVVLRKFLAGPGLDGVSLGYIAANTTP